MAGGASLPVQAAIRTTLLATAAVTGLLRSATSIYDEAPQGSVMPFITLDDMTEVAWNTMGLYGSNVTAMIHIWSDQGRGFAEADGIAQQVAQALRSPSGSTITPTGYTCHAVMYESTTRILEDMGDGRTVKHVAVLMRAYTTES